MFQKKIQDMKTIAALLKSAEQIAVDSGIGRPSAEHLVLAAIELPDGTARAAFEDCELDVAEFGKAIESRHAMALSAIGLQPAQYSNVEHTTPAPGVYHSEVSMQELFQTAAKFARARKTPFVGADVVAAASGLEQGIVAQALSEMGADRKRLRSAAVRAIEAAA